MHELTVVVPTSGGLPGLRRVLDSLEHQTRPREAYEVLLVDDGSTDGTERWCAGWQDGGVRRYVRQDRCGLPLARNLGVLMACSPLVLMLADDEVADPGLVDEHVLAHARFGDLETAVVGTAGWPAGSPCTPLMRYLSLADPLPLTYPSVPREHNPPVVHFRAHHVSVKRAFLAQRGLHRVAFGLLADVELACRLVVHGLRLRYWSYARSERLTTFTFDEWREHLRQLGHAAAAVAAVHDHPDVQHCVRRDAAVAEWAVAGPSYDDWCRRARTLESELGADHAGRADDELLPLWRAYWRCFAVSWARGVAEGVESG